MYTCVCVCVYLCLCVCVCVCVCVYNKMAATPEDCFVSFLFLGAATGSPYIVFISTSGM